MNNAYKIRVEKALLSCERQNYAMYLKKMHTFLHITANLTKGGTK